MDVRTSAPSASLATGTEASPRISRAVSLRFVPGAHVSSGLLAWAAILGLALGPILATTSRVACAQNTSPSDTADVRPASSLSITLGSMLPIMRPLGRPPSVAAVGRLTTVAGASTSVPITPAAALIDVRMYRTQLSSIFPLSSAYYPADSLRAVRVARAAQWVARLRASATPVDDRALVAFAQLAIEAEQDTLAKRLFDARLAELTTGKTLLSGERTLPIERSLTLDAAIQAFADPTQDSARIVANLPTVRGYITQLAEIPTRGYGNRSDSTVVLYRQFDAAVALLLASDAVHASDEVLAQSEHMLSLIPQFGLGERFGLLGGPYPYRQVATTLIAKPNGRARLDSLNARLLLLAVPRASEFPASMSEPQRENLRRQSRATIEDRIASFALIGRAAPPIYAHAWLHTSDSVYAPTPRVHPWNDGVIHVLVFGDMTQDNIAILERVQHHFPSDVQGVFVTHTEGHVGPDIKTPAEEVAWLTNFYDHVRHATIPIALWAGEKVSGPLGTSIPKLPTVSRDYHVPSLQGACVIIGGDGIVRGYEPIRTREDEIKLIDRIERLRARAASASNAGPSTPVASPSVSTASPTVQLSASSTSTSR